MESPLLAESMCSIEGPEFIPRGLIDPVFEPAVMPGVGVVLSEIYADMVFRLRPCSIIESKILLDSYKHWIKKNDRPSQQSPSVGFEIE
jgi:hypothetical protein